jgi:hypothetical protein
MSKLSFPLYHATNSLFEKSIIKFGLGGKNIIQELKVIELLNELINIAESKTPNNVVWINNRGISNLIAGQTSSMYEHGQTYLTASLIQAKRYLRNKYGSEIITLVFIIIKMLREENVIIPNSIIRNNKLLLNLENIDNEQIIYKINNLEIKYIEVLEDGNQDMDLIQKQIKQIENLISQYGIEKYDSFVQGLNFRVSKPISWDILNA